MTGAATNDQTVTQDRLIYVQWSDDGQHIRRWAREPFAGATAFANAGNGAPLGPFDRDDHYPVKELPFALRSIAENIHVQCAPHVLEDMVRIVADAASALEDRTARSGQGRKNDKPPSHWAANDKCDRHPQSAEEWDWHADSPGEDSFERSIKRLNFAVDRGDPDAPNQMALVLRVDLSRVLGRLVHYTAHRELLMQKQTGEGRSNGAGERGETAWLAEFAPNPVANHPSLESFLAWCAESMTD